MTLKFSRYRQASLLPGTGRHWNDPTSDSGYRRVTLRVGSLDVHGRALSVPVHVLAQGRNASGGLVFDSASGAPYTVYNEIETPDLLFYDLDPEQVVSLDVQGIRMGDPGESLLFQAEVDGEAYPGSKSWSQASGGMRGVLAHIMIDIKSLFKKS